MHCVSVHFVSVHCVSLKGMSEAIAAGEGGGEKKAEMWAYTSSVSAGSCCSWTSKPAPVNAAMSSVIREVLWFHLPQFL